MARGRPDPVEVWAPIFLYYAGTTAPKFTKDQVLDPKFAIMGDYCKLCDDHFEGSTKEHMRAHRKELTAWLGRRRREGEKRSKAGLAAWRKEQELAAKAQARGIIEGAVEFPADDEEN